MDKNISVIGAVPMMPQLAFDSPVNMDMAQGQTITIIGPNGAGKSILTDILSKKVPLREGSMKIGEKELHYDDVVTLSFRDIYSPAQLRDMYYQQRFNSFNSDEAPTVSEILSATHEDHDGELARICGIRDMYDKRTIALSSGETRKLHIFRALMKRPSLLILDNPFIGLDAASRRQVSDMLASMSLTGTACMFSVCDVEDIPPMTTHILPVMNRHIYPLMTKADFMADEVLRKKLFPEVEDDEVTFPAPVHDSDMYSSAVIMRGVNVKYGDRHILAGVDWHIRQGEKWSLAGRNGSGKSTLLSLICGDNPQAYANDITLFDRSRGTGESIWDIKKRIGYVSPEMHTCYMEDISCADVVVSGLFDTIGLFRRPTQEQKVLAERWLDVFGCGYMASRPFLKSSFGEQRMALLARAFVKNPQLLILDEPFHGLDMTRKSRAGKVIEAFCRQSGKTLIMVSHYESDIPPCVTLHKVL